MDRLEYWHLGRSKALGAALTVLMLAHPGKAQAASGFPTSRDPLKWPFSPQSIWNTPIGSGAVYVPAGIVKARERGMTVDPDILFLDASAPLTDILENRAGWEGRSRCPVEGGLVMRVPIPSAYVVPGGGPQDTPNNGAVFLMPDGRTLKQTQPFSRCVAGAAGTSQYVFPTLDIQGDGRAGSHGGSGLSAIGGTLRLGELVPGAPPIRHALKVNLFAKENVFFDAATQGFRWPAYRADSYAKDVYGGKNPSLRMGALLALPAAADLAALGLETEPARMLAWTLQNYGAYVVDDTFWSVYAIETEQSPAGTVTEEFRKSWGYPMDPQGFDNPWARDMDRIFRALNVVDNNGPTSIGGGGTSRQPPAPPFGNVALIRPIRAGGRLMAEALPYLMDGRRLGERSRRKDYLGCKPGRTEGIATLSLPFKSK